MEVGLQAIDFGAEGRNRTGTTLTGQRILSPLRLPIPPLRHMTRRSRPAAWPDEVGKHKNRRPADEEAPRLNLLSAGINALPEDDGGDDRI